MQGMRVAAEPPSAPPYATECTMTLSGKWPDIAKSHSVLSTSVLVVFPGGSGSLDLDELG